MLAHPLPAFADTDKSTAATPKGEPCSQPTAETAAGSCAHQTIVGTDFECNTAFTKEELRKLDTRFEPALAAATTIGEVDLSDLRDLISKHYAEEGYINSGAIGVRCENQIAIFSIVEGKAEIVLESAIQRERPDVRPDGSQKPDRSFYTVRKSYFEQRLSSAPFNVKELQERFRLLLAEPLFDHIQATVVPKDNDANRPDHSQVEAVPDREGSNGGKQVALVRIDKAVLAARPYSLSVFANNYQPAAIGAEALGLQGSLLNATSWGDELGAHLQGHDMDNLSYGLWWTVPVTYWTRVDARYSSGNSSVIEEPLAALEIESKLTSWEVGVEQNVFDVINTRDHASRHKQIWLGLRFAHRKNATFLLGQRFSFVPGESTGISEADTWQFNQSYLQRWQGKRLLQHLFHFRSAFNWGHSNVDPNLSGASDKNYLYWQGQAETSHQLDADERFKLRLKGSAQLTPDSLVPLERVAIGGIRTVRGYRENQIVRDNGYSVSAELAYKLPAWKAHSWSLIPFIDYGVGWNKNEKREKASSAGIGLEWKFKNTVSARLDLAKRLSTPAVRTTGDLQDRGIHFELRFTLPYKDWHE